MYFLKWNESSSYHSSNGAEFINLSILVKKCIFIWPRRLDILYLATFGCINSFLSFERVNFIMSTFRYRHRRHKLLLCRPPSCAWTSWLPQTRRTPAFFSIETWFQMDQSPRLKSRYLRASPDPSAEMCQAHFESVPLPLCSHNWLFTEYQF